MTDPWDAMATVGRVARPHGTRGHVVVDPETDFPEDRFAVGHVLQVRRAGTLDTLVVTAARLHQGRPIVAFEGIGDIDAAETLRGLELRVPDAALVRLPSGTFYRHDLVGCRVETVAGAVVGRVARVDGSLVRSWLVVTRGPDEGREDDRNDVLIPLVDRICVSIDPGAGRIVVDPPDGLLEVNAPEPRRREASAELEIG